MNIATVLPQFASAAGGADAAVLAIGPSIAPTSVNSAIGDVLSIVPGWILTVLAVIGAILVIGSLLWYFIQKGRGGGGGFPTWFVIGGACLVLVPTVAPLLGSLVDMVFAAIVTGANWIIGQGG